MDLKELVTTGNLNSHSTMAANILSRLVDMRKEAIRQSLAEFENIEHRLEHVATIRSIEFINDSKATNVNSAWYALESVKKPVIWIAGGLDKGNDYRSLLDLAKNKVKAMVCLGKDNSRLMNSFEGIIPAIVETASAEEAVKAAFLLGEKGDVVLFSPACASFDLFDNFEDRGEKFKQAVYDL